MEKEKASSVTSFQCTQDEDGMLPSYKLLCCTYVFICYLYIYILCKTDVSVCWHFATILPILSRWSPLSRRAHHVLLKRFRPWQRMGKQWTHFSKWFHVSSKCICGVCMLDVLLYVELLCLWPSCGGIISWCLLRKERDVQAQAILSFPYKPISCASAAVLKIVTHLALERIPHTIICVCASHSYPYCFYSLCVPT